MTEEKIFKELGKKSSAHKAAEYLRDGMTVGLGSGSTVYYAIKRIGDLAAEGLNVMCVSTSTSTTNLALDCGLKLVDLDHISGIDITIDGADEIDTQLNGIKGGGGALLFEKIVALSSTRNIWIADSSKLVQKLGQYPLPIEVIPFGYKRVEKILSDIGLKPELRLKGGEVYLTDSKNYIFDLAANEIESPEELHAQLKLINGVVETGLFCGIADVAIIGDGNNVSILERN